MKRLVAILSIIVSSVAAFAENYVVSSPSGANSIVLEWGDGALRWSASHNGVEVVAPSRLSMTTSKGVWGEGAEVMAKTPTENEQYRGCVVDFGEFEVEFRAYNDGVAYRFISDIAGDYYVVDELAEFSFAEMDMAWIPYVNFKPDATTDYATQFYTSFENTYD